MISQNVCDWESEWLQLVTFQIVFRNGKFCEVMWIKMEYVLHENKYRYSIMIDHGWCGRYSVAIRVIHVVVHCWWATCLYVVVNFTVITASEHFVVIIEVCTLDDVTGAGLLATAVSAWSLKTNNINLPFSYKLIRMRSFTHRLIFN